MLSEIGGKAIAESLKENRSLKILDISANTVGDEAGKTFAEMIARNNIL